MIEDVDALLNADLNAADAGSAPVVVASSTPEKEEDVTPAQSAPEVVQTEVSTPEPAPKEAPAPKVKKTAGRKVDTTGKTALGMARILHSQNPTLGTKELRALFLDKLGPQFGTTEAVAQTYVSLVRKPAKKKAATV